MSPTWGFSVPGFCVFDGLHEQVEGGGVWIAFPGSCGALAAIFPTATFPLYQGGQGPRRRGAGPTCRWPLPGLVVSAKAINRAIAMYWQAAAAQTYT